jgi:hypothetical protein
MSKRIAETFVLVMRDTARFIKVSDVSGAETLPTTPILVSGTIQTRKIPGERFVSF